MKKIILATICAFMLIGCGTANGTSVEDAETAMKEPEVKEPDPSAEVPAEGIEAEETPAAASFDVTSLKKFGDLYALKGDEITESFMDYVQIAIEFEEGGVPYRAVGNVSYEFFCEIEPLGLAGRRPISTEFKEKTSDLDILLVQNLNEMELTQEELDSLVGMTVNDILDKGWCLGGSSNNDSTASEFKYGDKTYVMTLDPTGTELNPYFLDYRKMVGPRRILTVQEGTLEDFPELI